MTATYTTGISVRDGVIYAEVCGEIDMVAAPRIRHEIGERLGTSPGGGLVIDLAGVTYMDSAGINLLLDLRRAATAGKTTIEIRGARGAPAAILEMTGVAALFAAGGDGSHSRGTDRTHPTVEAGGMTTRTPLEDGA